MNTEVCSDRESMGSTASQTVAEWMRAAIGKNGVCNIVFAAAPSQIEFLSALASEKNLEWTKVFAMHMDEYINLPAEAPQRFGTFLAAHLWDYVKPGEVHILNSMAPDPGAECERYAGILREHPLDIVCCGIGENGHIAFNDPGVADFQDPLLVKVVELDQQCRQQQVNNGCFGSILDVPAYAATLTIPALTAAPRLCCVVPGTTKAKAVKATLQDPISEKCPATILRCHPEAHLFLDQDSAAFLQ